MTQPVSGSPSRKAGTDGRSSTSAAPLLSPPAREPRQSEAVRSVVLGTAGHIDHGKTALVLALTGTDTDRFPEEKSRGITIDIGFASMRWSTPEGVVDLDLVDVPGHQAFIHNMLVGAGGIGAVLFVVAADEGVMAQTREHLAICCLLGVQAGVIALTKSDLVSSTRLEEVRREVRMLVESTFLQSAPMVAVSASTGEGIELLKTALQDVVAGIQEHSRKGVLRLPLDRAFSVAGFGTVVTGTLRDGTIRPGDHLQVQPGARNVRVRGVQVHHRGVDEARAPTRVALNLAGIEVSDVHRGDVVVQPGTLRPTEVVDVELTTLPGARPVRHRSRLGVHAFAAEATATLLLYETEEGESAGPKLARLRLSRPMVLAPGDRMVLRQRSPAEIIGGGIVLDASPVPGRRKSAVRESLRRLLGGSFRDCLLERIQRRGAGGIGVSELVQETGQKRDALCQAVAELLETGHVVAAAAGAAQTEHLVAREALQKATSTVFEELIRRPARSASRAELLSRSRLPEWVFALVLEELVRTRPVCIQGTRLEVRPEEPKSSTGTELLARVEALYRSAGLAAPIVSEAANTLQLREKELAGLITLLIRAGTLVRMGSDALLMHAEALAKLKLELGQHRGERFDVGRFKEFTGLTRKHAIPLLEYLDGARVTANRQGVRIVL